MPLRAGRRLADFTGTLEELRAQAAQIGDVYVRAVIVSEQPIPNLAAAANDAAPQAKFVSIDPRCAASQVAVLERTEADGEEPTLADLFREYLAGPGRMPGGAVADHILATFTGLFDDTASEEPGSFPEEEQLRLVLGDKPDQQPTSGDPLIPALAPTPAASSATAREQA